MRVKKNLTNKTFGNLTALAYAWHDRHSNAVWFCVCVCGKIRFVAGSSLLTGNTRSCGCTRSCTGRTRPNSRYRDLTNQTYERLTVLLKAGKDQQGLPVWFCACKCGKFCFVKAAQLLRSRGTKSCGCLKPEKARENGALTIKHGMCSSPEYRAYRGALQRCQNPRDKNYRNYGERGIEFRFKSFEEFYSCLGSRPSSKHSVDRINNDGHYEVGNVRWETMKTQSNNKRTVASLEAKIAELENTIRLLSL